MKYWICLFLLISSVTACQKKPIEKVEETFPDGHPKLVRTYQQEGKEQLLIKETYYHANHQKRMEGGMKNGKRHGKWTAWYEDGTIWSEGHYTEGVDDGLKTAYHDNGKKYYEGNYKLGERSGVWKFWDKEGKLIKEIQF